MSRLAIRGLICLPVVIGLQSCMFGDDNTRPTIADIKHESEVVRPAVSFDVDKTKVIKNYRELVSISSQDKNYGREIKRLADLELEASMDNKLSTDEAVVQQGEQESTMAIQRYQQYLETYPDGEDNDVILYQLSRAYAHAGEPDQALAAMSRLVERYPDSRYIDEVQFRRGESFFVSGQYALAEQAYGVVVKHHPDSLFYEKSLYKHGWALFKQSRYPQAIDSYVRLLDVNHGRNMIDESSVSGSLARGDRELLEDVLRVVSLSFSYLEDDRAIEQYFASKGKRVYEPLLYDELAKLYISKERLTDAVDVYLAYGEEYPDSPYAARYHSKAIDVYKRSGFASLLLQEKERFVKRYNKGSDFWKKQDTATQAELKPILTSHIEEIARHYHASARAGKDRKRYRKAANWYQMYITSFPDDEQAAEMNYLLAEVSYEAGDYPRAIAEYEKTAYQYQPHKNSAEAAYAALLSYDKLYRLSQPKDKPQIDTMRIQSSLKFSYFFPDDRRMPAVLLKTAERFFDAKDFTQASAAAERLVNNPAVMAKIKHKALILLAHSSFELKRYATAEDAYAKVLATMRPDDKAIKVMRNQLVASVYKQGEAERTLGNHQMAATHFQRIAKIKPVSSVHVIAAYDAATEYVAMENWSEVVRQLKSFRKTYPKQKKWRLGIAQKMALAYSNLDEPVSAADEMMKIVRLTPVQQQQDLLWQAADLYDKAGKKDKAVAIYKTYIKQYPTPLSRSIELRNKIALYYADRNDTSRRHYWLKQIVAADRKGGSQRTDRTRYLAATASLELVEPVYTQYAKVKLTAPLKKSLKKKKALMKKSIAAYTGAAKYQVEEVTTAATFYIAEIYRDFASALLASERPAKLNEEELEEYNYLLEDQAYPFEEKSIKIHETNLSRIPDGSYDDSIKKSLSVLSTMLPFRYAKSELTDAYVQ